MVMRTGLRRLVPHSWALCRNVQSRNFGLKLGGLLKSNTGPAVSTYARCVSPLASWYLMSSTPANLALPRIVALIQNVRFKHEWVGNRGKGG